MKNLLAKFVLPKGVSWDAIKRIEVAAVPPFPEQQKEIACAVRTQIERLVAKDPAAISSLAELAPDLPVPQTIDPAWVEAVQVRLALIELILVCVEACPHR
jgi:hypothetical protein